MVRAIAYTGKDGDFAENVPYILDCFDETTVEEKMQEIADLGGRNKIIFEYPGPDDTNTPELITWDYIKSHIKGGKS